MDAYGELCILLNRVFDHHAGLEQKYVADSEFQDITVNDMHIIDAIGSKISKSMSVVAENVGVTVGTLTIAMNALVKKGYIVRERSAKDRRVVLVSLSARGEAAYRYHQSFYIQMGESLQRHLDDEKCRLFINCLNHILEQST